MAAPVTVWWRSYQNWRHYRSDKVKYELFFHSRASNPKVDSPIWPEFEFIQDFMAVLVTCKIDEEPIKSKVAIILTIFSPLKVYGKFFCLARASYSKVNNLIWPEIELVRDFMDVLVTCKFHEALIKNEVVIDRTTFSSFQSGLSKMYRTHVYRKILNSHEGDIFEILVKSGNGICFTTEICFRRNFMAHYREFTCMSLFILYLWLSLF